MTSKQTSTSTPSPTRALSPLQLFVDLIRKKPTLGETKHKLSFKALILQEENEDYLRAMIDEWEAIKYSTAYNIAVPPTREEIVERREVAIESAAKERGQVYERAKGIITARLLDFTLPTGKALRDSTGKECAKAGGWLSKISESIKPGEVVGKVLSEADVRKLLA